jgi:hypothetical protein
LIQPGGAYDLYTAAVGIGARAGSAVAVNLEYGTTARAKSLESQTIRTKLLPSDRLGEPLMIHGRPPPLAKQEGMR